MTINEAIGIAERLESLFRRSHNFGKKREDILEEVWDIADDMRKWADRLDQDIIKSCSNEQEA